MPLNFLLSKFTNNIMDPNDDSKNTIERVFLLCLRGLLEKDRKIDPTFFG
jgi:hypothetical protein